MSLCTIVGMGPGIGLSVATRFAREGFDIAMIARTSERLGEYSKIVEETSGVKTTYFSADVSDPTHLRTALSYVQGHEPTEVLVYNAAVVQKTKLSTLSPENLMHHLRVNVIGAVTAVQQVLPGMQRTGKGTILFTGGGFAHDPQPDYFALGMGKAALLNYGKSLAKAYPQIHVAVVTIHGKVERGTACDPDLIANKYWNLHSQPDYWEPEVHVK